MRIIQTENAPTPAGHYAQAIERDGILYISGQLPISATGAHAPEASFEDQVRRAMGNLLAILQAAGGAEQDLVRVTAYVVGIANWPRLNQIYAEILGPHRPARSIVPVPELHYGYLVEIDAIAHLSRPSEAG